MPENLWRVDGLAAAPKVLVVWHLLSLDAPTVAVLWTVFLARLTGAVVPVATLVATALAVWILYAADRLFDTRHLSRTKGSPSLHDFEVRHLFHYRHRFAFAVGLAVATVSLAVVVPGIPRSALSLYLVEAALVSGYFWLIHGTPARRRRALPKECLVGLFFAGATFIPTLSHAPTLRPTLALDELLFTALCTLNCLHIYTWEHPHAEHPHGPTRAAIYLLVPATVALVVVSLPLIFFSAGHREEAFYPMACALSAGALLLLHGVRDRLSRMTLRAAADAALLTPIFFFAFH